MRVIIFGATGMVGQGALRESLADIRVEVVLTVGRRATGLAHAKLRELVRADLFDYSRVESELTGYDACLFCLGVSSAGMNEAEYTRVIHELTMAAAQTLARLNPTMTLCFVSGAGTDSTEQGRSMWARVKGRTENALLKLPFKAAYMFRPAFILPLDGITSRTASYRIIYSVLKPLSPLLLRMPRLATTTRKLGRAMLNAAATGAPKPVLESADLNELGGAGL